MPARPYMQRLSVLSRSFRLPAAPRLRKGVPHGFAVARRRSLGARLRRQALAPYGFKIERAPRRTK
jgi:hypothetical protein